MQKDDQVALGNTAGGNAKKERHVEDRDRERDEIEQVARDILWGFTKQAPERGGFGPDDVARAVAVLRRSRAVLPKQEDKNDESRVDRQ